jgi:Rps23 Pro-64 3,4-dihydroxylase Tpa1-like proline 4-hydroxylase
MSKEIPDFINKKFYIREFIDYYNKLYKTDNVVNIPDFISSNVSKDIRDEIENYDSWVYSILPNDINDGSVKFADKISIEDISRCQYHLEQKDFCYRFKRTSINHPQECMCICCRLTETIKCRKITDLICKIIGVNSILLTNRAACFLSNYSKDDFLSMHTDGKKGDISVTFSFTDDWEPSYGGILHLCDNKQNIYRSIVPKLGSLNIMRLSPSMGIPHFVSCVNVNKNRYTLTTWYKIIE